MSKIVYNACHGGFGLSDEAVIMYSKLKGIALYRHSASNSMVTHWTLLPSEEFDKLKTVYERNEYYFDPCNIDRDDHHLISVVEELGDKANGRHAELVVVNLEPGTIYKININDNGNETLIIKECELKRDGFKIAT